MKIRKWCSNEAAGFEEVVPGGRTSNVDIQRGSLPTVKTLGVSCEVKIDSFTFHLVRPPKIKQFTKIVVASLAARVFHPLQVLCSFIIQANILMQKLWVRCISWHEDLLDDFSEAWHKWFPQLPSLADLKLARGLRQFG